MYFNCNILQIKRELFEGCEKPIINFRYRAFMIFMLVLTTNSQNSLKLCVMSSTRQLGWRRFLRKIISMLSIPGEGLHCFASPSGLMVRSEKLFDSFWWCDSSCICLWRCSIEWTNCSRFYRAWCSYLPRVWFNRNCPCTFCQSLAITILLRLDRSLTICKSLALVKMMSFK